jgi:hypothetical protein
LARVTRAAARADSGEGLPTGGGLAGAVAAMRAGAGAAAAGAGGSAVSLASVACA